MPFVRITGLKGKIWVPEANRARPKKHPCKDCFSCEHCSDDRCNVCSKDKGNRSDVIGRPGSKEKETIDKKCSE